MSFTNAKIVGTGFDPNEYHHQVVSRGDPKFEMTRSDLCAFALNPRRWLDGYEPAESSAKQNGSLLDVLLLDAKRFYSDYVEVPEKYKDPKTGELKDWNFNAIVCKDWRKTHGGKTEVKHDDLIAARIALAKLKENDLAVEVLDGASFQVLVTADYVDRDTDITIPVKALLDIVPSSSGRFHALLVDFKTSRSAEPHAWAKSVFSFGYHVQGALQLDLYCAATGEDRNTFANLVQENVPPYFVDAKMLSVEFVELGRNQYKSALKLYCQCLATGMWPGYHSETVIDGFNLVQPAAWMAMADQTPYRFHAANVSVTAAEEPADVIP